MSSSTSTISASPLTGPVVAAVATPARRVSWGAITAGMVIAVVVQLVLSLVGTSIGASTLDPLHFNSPDLSSLGTGAAVWWALSSVIALFAGGWVAGHLSGSVEKTDATLHGLLAWGLATLVTVYVLASAIGAVVGGSARVVGAAATATASGAAAVAGPATDMAKRELSARGVSLDDLQAQVKALLAQTGKPALQPGAIADKAQTTARQAGDDAAKAGSGGGSAVDDLQSVLQRIIDSGKETVDQADREAVVNVVVARTGVSRAEAEQRVDGWIQTYRQARAKLDQLKADTEAKARQAADAAARASSKAALGGAIALLLGAVAAAIGGLTARRRHEAVTVR